MKLYLVLNVILLCGCASEYHDQNGLYRPEDSDLRSGQPTLRWVAEGGPDVSYDVIVYEAIRLNNAWIPGNRVCYIEGLTDLFYKFPQPLEPGEYCWSVRVRRPNEVKPWRLINHTDNYGLLWISTKNGYARFQIPKQR